ncbi:MAG: amidohydrolase family protein [Anaerolineae bacterium]
MDFFDCNVTYGRPPVPGYRIAADPEALLREMDWVGVGRALVTNAQHRHDDPIDGNAQVLLDCRGSDRLQPMWAMMPPQTGEFPGPNELPDVLRQNGVRALWAWPSRNRYSLDANTFGPTLEVLSERRIPLFVSLEDSSHGLTGWPLMANILANFPNLTLVAADQGCWGQDRHFRPLVDKYERFYFDVYDYQLAGGYEDYCRCYGPERMLFATGFPTNNMGGAVLTLMHADIRQEWKEAIASANLVRLLEEVRL